MKTVVNVLLAAVMVVMVGCASSRTIDPNYQAYVQTAQATQKPLLKLSLDESGRVKEIEMHQPLQVQQKQPDAPHPVWGVLSGAIRAAGIVGGIWAGGEALQGVVEASRGVTTYTAGGSIAGGDVSIPTTTTTTTTTTDTTTTNTDESTTFTEN